MLMYPFEAESVAFVVCQYYGIDTSDYSFGYVAGWSTGKETPELKTSLQTIRDAASQMIHVIDDKLEEHSKAKEITKKKSVKEKLAEGKEKAAKTPVKRTKAKGAEIA